MNALKAIKATVSGGSARLMMALALTIFFIGLLSRNSYADDANDLIDAAKRGDISSVKALLDYLGRDKDADVNAENKDNWSALMAAFFVGHFEIVKLLSRQRR